MKTWPLLLVISMVAVAQEATAQDAQCVRERTAMVGTIRAYARSHVSVLGQQGLSERVLEATGKRNANRSSLNDLAAIAYADTSIPIGVSSPYRTHSSSPR